MGKDHIIKVVIIMFTDTGTFTGHRPEQNHINTPVRPLLLYAILKRLSVGVREMEKGRSCEEKVCTESGMMGKRAVERIDG